VVLRCFKQVTPGKLFDVLAWGNGLQGPSANPVVILDEIDKANTDRYDPLAAMYSLLEADTSARFQDQSVPDVWIDASRVKFICTANDISKIPRPLISRMTVFQIEKPSDQQLRLVLQNIYRDLVDEIRLPFSVELPAEIIDAALGMSPREAKIRLECSIASAVADDRSKLLAWEWPDLPNAESHDRKSIGFISN
jgi:ATP-dependent Lon protease